MRKTKMNCDFEKLAQTDPDQLRLEIEKALQRLARDGLIYDTGQKRWSERNGRYETVWAAVDPNACAWMN
jgi:predicted transcriptional regulator